MRTVLALDDLMAVAVKKKLGDGAIPVSRPQMRELGDDVVLDMLGSRDAVLAIGGTDWDPLDLLERWRLPERVPVVLVLPWVSWKARARAARVNAFSVLGVNELKRKLPTSLATECRLAAKWLREARKRPYPTVVIQPSPLELDPRPARAVPGRLLHLPVRGVSANDVIRSP